MAVVRRCRVIERIGEILRPVVAVQVFKQSEASTCICWNIDDPHFLPSRCAPAVLGDLIGKANLTGGDEKDTPLGTGPYVTGPSRARFALSVWQHVRRTKGGARFDLRHFIETQKRVAMRDSGALQSVVCRAPG